MSFDVRNIPSVIQGVERGPVVYGRSAHAQYMGYLNAAQDEFVRSGDLTPVERLNQAAIRYTPEGTIAEGAVTEEAIQNALGYAAANIQRFDLNGDRALDRFEVLYTFLAPAQAQLNKLAQTLADPNASQEAKEEAAQYQNLILNYSMMQAANYIASIDVADPSTGQRDGKITADEAAAKLLFDDNAKQMFEGNAIAYKTIIDGLQAKTDYAGPSFEQLQQRVQGIVGQSNSPFRLDGMLTTG
ncbi:MAG TPA: hypothetical protein V6C99_06995, partial [Oculatellaceae cyanobacterium]